MILHFQDLAFKVHSPSLYELASVRDDVGSEAKVYVEYTGRTWLIHYRSPTADISRPFKSRDAAIELIRNRAP